MAIRRAEAAEAAAVAALVERAYAPWVAVIGRRPAPMDDNYVARCAAGQAFILEREGVLAAAIVLEDEADHLWLDNVAVDPRWQGKGLGRALLDFAETEGRRRGFAEVRLLTHQKMLSNIALYARLGYVETGRRVEDGFARVFMAKRIAA
jgi:ribosomal protein S18 acetylase RimI-like enzyme